MAPCVSDLAKFINPGLTPLAKDHYSSHHVHFFLEIKGIFNYIYLLMYVFMCIYVYTCAIA